MTTGDVIKYRRNQLGLTQKELSKKIGVSFQMIAKWEKLKDIDTMQFSTIKKLATALEMDVSYLLYPETIIDIVLSALRDACIQDDVFSASVDNAILVYIENNYDNYISNYISGFQFHENMYLHLNNLYTSSPFTSTEVEFINLFYWLFNSYYDIEERVCDIIRNDLGNSSTNASNPTNAQNNQICDKQLNILHDISFFSYTYGNIIKTFPTLNSLGIKKAAELLELVAKIPEYQEQNNKDEIDVVENILNVDSILFQENKNALCSTSNNK
jgi:transcriptional regulator with XRE-family HTH domain